VPPDPEHLEQLGHLLHRERSLNARWERLVEYVASYPTSINVRQEREARHEREEVIHQIDGLRKQIAFEVALDRLTFEPPGLS
jgi:hypothetical protein